MESDKVNEENNKEVVLAEYSDKTLHKLIKSGMWKMYCSRDFQIVSVEWSDELRRMVGYQNEEDFPNVLESWENLLHPEDHKRVMEEIDPVLRDVTENTIFDQEYRLETKNRGYRWFRAAGDVSRREDGTPYCFFGVFLDITEQKEHAELEKAGDEALKQANNALTAMNVLHQAMGSGAWSNTFHEDGRSVAVEWSNAFRALLGFENEEDFPNSERVFFERVHPDDWERMMQLSTNVVNGNIFLEGKYLKLPKMTAIRIKLYRPISEKFLGIDFAMHGMCVFYR